MERQIHAHRRREIMRPHAATDHHIAAADLTLSRAHTRDLISIAQDRFDFGVRENPRTAAFRPFGQCLGDVHRVGVAVGGNMDPAKQIVGLY